MPVEVVPLDDSQSFDNNAMQTCRLSSFGYSGTIAHGAFGIEGNSFMSDRTRDSKSLYRSRRTAGLGSTVRPWLSWLAEIPGPRYSTPLLDDETVVSSGTLAPLVEDCFSHHVIAGNILLPGTGYVEMTFAASFGRFNALKGVMVLRPCVLPRPGKKSQQYELRCL